MQSIMDKLRRSMDNPGIYLSGDTTCITQKQGSILLPPLRSFSDPLCLPRRLQAGRFTVQGRK
jgi:hypothetical protein